MLKPTVTFVIMAGGKGERLWPLVHGQMPKVCLSPNGTRSLIQQTIDRLKPIAPQADWLIITTPGQDGPIRKALASKQKIKIVVEPEGKNTAACIALAAAAVGGRSPKRVMVAVPADHWMGDIPAFQQAMRTAINCAAKTGALVMIGIPPRSPHTGLGYLCAGQAVNGSKPAVHPLKRFIEKPTLAAAKKLVKQPGTFWNSGMFIGSAGQFIHEVTRCLPDHGRLVASLAPFFAERKENGVLFKRKLSEAYGRLPRISFDHGVMQNVRRAFVVDGQFGWEDLGSWDSWAKLGKSSSQAVLVDSRNVSVVGQPSHLVAAIGMQDMIVVQTPKATLICHPSRSQDVRKVVKRLSLQGRLAQYL